MYVTTVTKFVLCRPQIPGLSIDTDTSTCELNCSAVLLSGLGARDAMALVVEFSNDKKEALDWPVVAMYRLAVRSVDIACIS